MHAFRPIRRILVVDDDPDWRLFVRLALEDMRYEVLEAGDVESARALLQRETLDLILLDLNLPGVSGAELAASLPPGSPRVVFVTAATPSEAAPALRTGPHYYLPKAAERGALELLLHSLGA